MTVNAYPACLVRLGITPNLWSTAMSILVDFACLACTVANGVSIKAIEFGGDVRYRNSATQQFAFRVPISVLARRSVPHGCRALLNQKSICQRSTTSLRSASSQEEPSICRHYGKPSSNFLLYLDRKRQNCLRPHPTVNHQDERNIMPVKPERILFLRQTSIRFGVQLAF